MDSLTQLESSVQQAFGGASASSSSSSATSLAPAPRPLPSSSSSSSSGTGRRSGGLPSSLSLPAQLKDYWFAAEFSASLGTDTMVPFELFGEVRCCCC